MLCSTHLRRLAVACSMLGLVAAPGQGASRVDGRPISPAEAAALELAIGYLEEGPAAWREAMSPDSRLVAIEESELLRAIEVRVGPPDGARWTLTTPGARAPMDTALFEVEMPSGHQETVVLRLVMDGGEWKILDVRSLVEEIWPADAVPTGGTAAGSKWAPAAPGQLPFAALGLTIGALVLLGPRRRRRTVLLLCLGGLLACADEATAPPDPTPAAPVVAKDWLVPLHALRIALATGSPDRAEAVLAALEVDGPAADVARLWEADLRYRQRRLDEAAALLSEIDPALDAPLLDLVQARVDLARGQEQDGFLSYADALEHGYDHDLLRTEIAEAYLSRGYVDEADAVFLEAATLGSRSASIAYQLARIARSRGFEDQAAADFLAGWKLEPMARRQIFADTLLASIAAHDTIYRLLALHQAEEPVPPPPAAERRRPLPAFENASVRIFGDTLLAQAGTGHLRAPGAARFAPSFAPSFDAETMLRRAEAEAIGALEEQRRLSGALTLSDPSVRRRFDAAVRALLRRHDWGGLVELTSAVDGSLTTVPPLWVQARALALRREDDVGGATALLTRFAQITSRRRSPDAGTLVLLGGMLAELGRHDLALRLVTRARDLEPALVPPGALERLQLHQALYENPAYLVRKNFLFTFPRSAVRDHVLDLAYVVEEELKRLRRWIPLADNGAPFRIDIDLFRLHDFLPVYARDLAVAGVYDGIIRLPFADIASLQPAIVTVLTHELAHAMIDEYAGDTVPRWFHEGLASHVEMVQDEVNIFPLLADTSSQLSLVLVEILLDRGINQPEFVELAYKQSAWTVHFIEERYGVEAIGELLKVFGRGATTEQAVAQVFDMSIGELDSAVLAWARNKGPITWPVEVRRYDHELQLARLFGKEPGAGLVEEAGRWAQEKARVDQEEREREKDARQAEKDRRRAILETWYRDRFLPAAQPMVEALQRFAEADQSSAPELAALCRTLGETSEVARRRQGFSESPDPRANRYIVAALGAIDATARSCRRGRSAEMRRSFESARSELRKLKRILTELDLE